MRFAQFTEGMPMLTCVDHQNSVPPLFDTVIVSERVLQTAWIVLFPTIVCTIHHCPSSAVCGCHVSVTRWSSPGNSYLFILAIFKLVGICNHPGLSTHNLPLKMTLIYRACVRSARQNSTSNPEQSCFVMLHRPGHNGCSLTGHCRIICSLTLTRLETI